MKTAIFPQFGVDAACGFQAETDMSSGWGSAAACSCVGVVVSPALSVTLEVGFTDAIHSAGSISAISMDLGAGAKGGIPKCGFRATRGSMWMTLVHSWWGGAGAGSAESPLRVVWLPVFNPLCYPCRFPPPLGPSLPLGTTITKEW